jgi:anaerobic selenocysteine-containing dehydrogenase
MRYWQGMAMAAGLERTVPDAGNRPSPDYANARFILLLSSHLETGHYFNPHAQRIIEARARGAKLVVMDVRLSNTATHADHWLAPYPGSEPALCLAIANHLIATRRYDREFVRRWWNWHEYLTACHPDVEPTFERFEEGKAPHLRDRFSYFCAREARWLQDYALFMTLKGLHDERPWVEWEPTYRHSDDDAIAFVYAEHGRGVRYHQFTQFLFDRQWKGLRSYCNERSIQIFGDAPIYVAHDSSDVWAHQDLFFLDDDGQADLHRSPPAR